MSYLQIKPRYIQGGINKILIKITLITKGIAELLRENVHEVPVFR